MDAQNMEDNAEVEIIEHEIGIKKDVDDEQGECQREDDYQIVTQQNKEDKKTMESIKQDEDEDSSANQQELFQVTLRYQEKIKDVKSQNIKLKQAKDALEDITQSFAADTTAYPKLVDAFYKEFREFDSTINHYPSEKLAQMKNSYDLANKNLQSFQHKISASLDQLIHKKQVFEKELANLQEQEKYLLELQQSLISAHKGIGIFAQFSSEADNLSKNYVLQQVDESELPDLFANNKVQNVEVCLQSYSKDIMVTESVRLYGFRATSAGQGIKYIKIHAKNKNIRVVLENCQLQGVGICMLGINDEKCTGGIFMKNCIVRDSLEAGIKVVNSRNCSLENVEVKGNQKMSGIEFENVNNCLIQDVSVQDSQRHGIYFNRTKGTIEKCSVSNSGEYSVYLENNCTIYGSHIQTNNNKYDQIFGTLLKK
eukprot:TRINITY_DN488_c1_g1_i5.p1 TRINITY_DN488_c1_g1~~TRINITY_DN488_c1_g1_i5.p1  ORF type:complete len:426 (+),score=43.82 TRINITY_DN488_c1_g1_i5:294-1571(+)